MSGNDKKEESKGGAAPSSAAPPPAPSAVEAIEEDDEFEEFEPCQWSGQDEDAEDSQQWQVRSSRSSYVRHVCRGIDDGGWMGSRALVPCRAERGSQARADVVGSEGAALVPHATGILPKSTPLGIHRERAKGGDDTNEMHVSSCKNI